LPPRPQLGADYGLVSRSHRTFEAGPQFGFDAMEEREVARGLNGNGTPLLCGQDKQPYRFTLNVG
jgi:hypothetical protein